MSRCVKKAKRERGLQCIFKTSESRRGKTTKTSKKKEPTDKAPQPQPYLRRMRKGPPFSSCGPCPSSPQVHGPVYCPLPTGHQSTVTSPPVRPCLRSFFCASLALSYLNPTLRLLSCSVVLGLPSMAFLFPWLLPRLPACLSHSTLSL